MPRRPVKAIPTRKRSSADDETADANTMALPAVENPATEPGPAPEKENLTMASVPTPEPANPFASSTRKVHNYAWGAAAAGLLPAVLPGGALLDFAGVLGVQTVLIVRLAKGYGIPVTEHLAKEAAGALLGALTAALGYKTAAAAFRVVPVIGPLLGLAVVPGFNYLSTVAVGRTFEKHFASGGTWLTLDLDSMKKAVVVEYNEAKASFIGGKAALAEENARLKQQLADLQARMERGGVATEPA